VLADDRHLSRGLIEKLADHGPLGVIAHGLGPLLRLDYLFGLAPVLAGSLLATFAVLLSHGLERLAVAARPRRSIVALFTTLLATTYLFQYHAVYVHENLGSAAYLFLFVALFWLAEADDDATLIPIAFLGLAAFCLARIVNPIPAALFVVLAVGGSRLPRRAVGPWLVSFVVVSGGWNLAMVLLLPSGGGMKLNAERALLMTVVLAGAVCSWLASRRPAVARLFHHLPRLVAIAMALAVVVTFAARPAVMIASLEAYVQNLVRFDDWGLTWTAIATLAALGLWVARPPGHAPFTVGIPAYLALVLLFAFAHGVYTAKSNESSARLALHVVPLILFYLALKLALALRPAEARVSRVAEAAAATGAASSASR
jgi:hypothetical protein